MSWLNLDWAVRCCMLLSLLINSDSRRFFNGQYTFETGMEHILTQNIFIDCIDIDINVHVHCFFRQ